MALNTSGLADAADYVLGRGVVQIARLDANGDPGPWRDLGNAPSFSLTGASQTVEHQSSRHGTAFIDKKVITSQSLSCAFEIDEVQNFENLADWLVGDASRATNGYAVGNAAQVTLVADGSLASYLGRSVLLFSDNGVRIYNAVTGDVVVKTKEASPVTLVDGTDYVLDVENGSIFLIADSTALATALGAGKGVSAKVTAQAGQANVDRVRAFTATGLDVAVRFVLENAADDANQSEILLPNVNLASDGDMALIGKDFAAVKFNGTLSPGKVGSKFAGEYCLITDGGTSGA